MAGKMISIEQEAALQQVKNLNGAGELLQGIYSQLFSTNDGMICVSRLAKCADDLQNLLMEYGDLLEKNAADIEKKINEFITLDNASNS